jgi:hypothetical protein
VATAPALDTVLDETELDPSAEPPAFPAPPVVPAAVTVAIVVTAGPSAPVPVPDTLAVTPVLTGPAVDEDTTPSLSPLVTTVVATAAAVVAVVSTTTTPPLVVVPPALVNPVQNCGVTVSVPSYSGHPGTVLLGGARPPPQSINSQISPVSGTYHSSVLYRVPTSVETQPAMLVRADTLPAKRSRVAVRRDWGVVGAMVVGM